MAQDPVLIIQLPSGGATERNLAEDAPEAVASGEIVVSGSPPDDQGHLEPPEAGEVVLAVPSPEALAREADEVRRVIAQAGTGAAPLVVVVEAAEHLRDDELAPMLEAARHTPRAVILHIVRDA
jgi:hypothetical protein